MLSNPAGGVLGETAVAVLTIGDNDNGVSGQIRLTDGTPASGVFFSATGGGICTTSDAAGSYSCAVPAGWSGSIAPALGGLAFSPASTAYVDVNAFITAQDYTADVQSETVWVEDAVPAGAKQVGTWNFTSADPVPFSGALAHRSGPQAGMHQHYFTGAGEPLVVNAGDTLIAAVYLDPANPPSEVMLQWREGSSWQHRAYWGADNISWGTAGTASRRYMGPLPALAGWVRLEVPAAAVGLENTVVNGMAFTLYDGQATWDYAGKR
jgi:hypothetical protein